METKFLVIAESDAVDRTGIDYDHDHDHEHRSAEHERELAHEWQTGDRLSRLKA